MEATLHRFPDFNLLQNEILPRYLDGKDWLLPLLLHAKTHTVCMDFGCTTCGAGPFKQSLRLMWQISRDNGSSQNGDFANKDFNLMQAEKMSHEQFSLDEIKILIKGLTQMEVKSSAEQTTSLLGNDHSPEHNEFRFVFPEPYICNPLMMLLTMIYHRTSSLSMRHYGDPHKLMQLTLKDSAIYDYFQMMYKHWQNKMAISNR